MRPNETTSLPDAAGLDRREFLRLSGTLAAAGALASAGCQPPQETTIPFHDMPVASGWGEVSVGVIVISL